MSAFGSSQNLAYRFPNSSVHLGLRYVRLFGFPRKQDALFPREHFRWGRCGMPMQQCSWLPLVAPLRRAGVEFMAGTDTPVPSAAGFASHDELALLVKGGLTPEEALETATRNPARFLGRERDLGTVERSKIADLVLLIPNPLQDIHNTTKISAVILHGQFLDRRVLDGMMKDAAAAGTSKTTART